MRVDELAPAPGSTQGQEARRSWHRRQGRQDRRRGTKGQYARDTVARGFEGGQTPLKQRVPKLKGFNNPFRVEYTPVNLDQLEALGARRRSTPTSLVASGLVRKGTFVKVLARGEMTTAVRCPAHAVSKAAESAITAAGGSVTLLPLPFKAEGAPVARRSRATSSPTAERTESIAAAPRNIATHMSRSPLS